MITAESNRSRPGRPSPPETPVRVGLILDSYLQPRWIEGLVRRLLSSADVRITRVLMQPGDVTLAGRASRAWKRPRLWLYLLYRLLDQRVFGRPDDALALVDLADLLRHAPTERLASRFGADDGIAPCDAAESSLEPDLDVALHLGGRRPRGKALRMARYGVWSCGVLDRSPDEPAAPGFWEVMLDHPVSAARLLALSDDSQADLPIASSVTATERRSAHRNLSKLCARSASLVPRALRDLGDRDPGGVGPLSVASKSFPLQARPETLPGNLRMLGLGARFALRYAGSRLRAATSFPQWCLALCAGDRPTTADRIRYLVPPPDRFWADPFPVRHAGRTYIFLEEVLYRLDKGRIAVIEIEDDGRCGGPIPVLEREDHLSYPFVFEWNGSWYMIPETGARRTVELYRCTSFPGAWTLERVLMSGVRTADVTLHFQDGRWWMFVCMAEDDLPLWDELYLFHAPTPLGPWEPHRRNPVRSDVRSSRPAGRLQRRGPELIRPAQDCSRGYGYAIAINRVVRLDPETYDEEVIETILPDWDPRVVAVHTVNAMPGLTVFDCLRRRPRSTPQEGSR